MNIPDFRPVETHGVYATPPEPYESTRLAELIGMVIDQYERDRASYFRVNPRPFFDDQEEPSFLVGVDLCGSTILNAVGMLQTGETDDTERAWVLLTIIGFLHPHALHVRERMQINLARDFLGNLGQQVHRAQSLSLQLIRSIVSGPTARYLQSVARCYISGYFPESIILARSALETSLRSAFELRGEDIPQPAQGSAVRHHLKLATQNGWLTPELERLAWSVWLRGNKIVHEDIPTDVDHIARRTLKDLTTVVHRLFAGLDPSAA